MSFVKNYEPTLSVWVHRIGAGVIVSLSLILFGMIAGI